MRALVVSPEREVLLMRVHFPWRRAETWIAPGGGIRRGESAADALVREIHEETGRRIERPGPEIWTSARLFDHAEPQLLQRERYFLVQSSRFEPRSDGLREGHERDWFGGYRWWPSHELPDRDERFAPTRLGALVRALLEGGPPRAPIDVGT